MYHACFHSGTTRFSVSNSAFTFDSTARPIALCVAYGFTKLVSLRICLVCGQILHLLHMFPGCFRKIVIIQHIRRHISLTIESKYISVKFCLFINPFYLPFWKEENYLDYKKNWTIVKTKFHIWREETLK